METITFDNLPKAMIEVIERLERIENILTGQKVAEVDSDWMDVEQASVFLNISKATIYSMTHLGTIAHYKKGNKLYFSKKELNEYLKSGRVRTKKEIADGAMDLIRERRS